MTPRRIVAPLRAPDPPVRTLHTAAQLAAAYDVDLSYHHSWPDRVSLVGSCDLSLRTVVEILQRSGLLRMAEWGEA